MDEPTQQAQQVVIYSTPTCHFCHMTKEFLTEKEIAFTDYDVAEDTEKRNEMIAKSGQMGVPVIIISDPNKKNEEGEPQEEIIIGFDKERLMQLLGIQE